MIRCASIADASAIRAIYNHYVTDTVITFEEQPVTTAEMQSRMAAVLERLPWLVPERDGDIAGYAYASPWKARSISRPRMSGMDSGPRCTKPCSSACEHGASIA